MVSDRPHGQILVLVIAIALASVLVPGALAQETGTSEQEPNDTPQNATFVQPGTPVSGEITASTNASEADADWFALPVQAGQNVTVSFESGPDAERLIVFLASPNGSGNVSAVNDTVADATIAPSGTTVTLSATANESRVYFVGVTGLSGEYEFTVETSGSGIVMGQNGTNMTGEMNGTNETGMTNASSATRTTTGTSAGATTTQTVPDTTTTATSTTSSANSGGSSANASGEGTSASGPGFGLLAALVALLAAALLVARRR